LPNSSPAPTPSEPHSSEAAKIRRRAFLVIFLGMLCLGMGHSITFTTLPPLAREIGLDERQVGAIFSLSGLLWVIMSPFWGRKSDGWGRRPALIIGLVGFSISQFLFASAIRSFFWGAISITLLFPILIASRAIYGFLGAAGPPAAQAYVADRTSRKERTKTVATIGAAFGMGMAVAPGFAAGFAVFGLLAPFYAVGFFALVFAVLIYFYVPETIKPRLHARGHHEDKEVRLRIYDSRVWPFLALSIAFSIGGASVFQTITYLYIDKLQLDAIQGTQMASVGMMASAMSTLFAQLVLVPRLKLSSRVMMLLGTLASIPAFAIFIVADQYGPMVFAQMLMGLSAGFAGPGIAASASLNVEPEEQGSVAGIIGGSGAFGFILTPIIGMPLYQLNINYPYYMALAITLCALVFLLSNKTLRSVREHVPSEEEMLATSDERPTP
jgi:MFS family permease